MKKTVLFTLFVGLLLSFQAKAQNSVTVKVTNIQSKKGTIYIGFYSENQDFPNHSAKHLKKSVKPTKGSVELTIDLPKGTYAIAVLHDTNGNDKLDENFFGIPKEPYGFSKNVHHSFSASTFDECKFKLENEKLDFVIKLKQ
jgi:uncharacterized protein (DUF2141 family)